MKQITRAHLALILITIIWGLTFPLIRQALLNLDSTWFVFLRFALASLLFVVLLLVQRKFYWHKQLLLWGIAVGVINSLSYSLQTLGLETVASGRAAFITGLNVVMVPLLAVAFKVAKSNWLDYFCAGLACLGIFILCNPKQSPFTFGDAMVFISAIFYSLFVLSLQTVAKKFPKQLNLLACYQVFGVLLASVVFLPLAKEVPSSLSSQAWVAIVFCATFATVGVFWLQTNYQHYTTPQRTSLIFSLEPVFAALFGYLLIAEKLGFNEVLGGAVILMACLIPEFLKVKRVQN
ncbi:MAG TPA: DMT family transporter [Oligoflexia bacterium]|nr:DMT family transporter [Oligoflexia bacterium]HMR25563.1 DMT family transporter [Oligoflexia bacterium]